MKHTNSDSKIIEGFGDEWSRLDQTRMRVDDSSRLFKAYFSIFPWESLPPTAEGFDLGCGSGRWAKHVAPKVGKLHCIDPSIAIEIARKNLQEIENCEFHKASVDGIPFSDSSMDFGYSLGVLHHIPNTAEALASCVAKLKPGAPFLLYVYYSFDNRPVWYRSIWKASELIRLLISRLPFALRYFLSQFIAIFIYLPLARLARFIELLGFNVKNYPLTEYRSLGFYVMRTDALDRFGTRLEQRFSRIEIQKMMEKASLENIVFSERPPFWCAVGFKKSRF